MTTRFIYADGSSRVYPVPVFDPALEFAGFWLGGWREDGLERLRSQHVETQYNLRYQFRHLTDEGPRLQKRLEEVQKDIAVRHDTSGDKFVIEIEGQSRRSQYE